MAKELHLVRCFENTLCSSTEIIMDKTKLIFKKLCLSLFKGLVLLNQKGDTANHSMKTKFEILPSSINCGTNGFVWKDVEP
jgi:hypothetical protein